MKIAQLNSAFYKTEPNSNHAIYSHVAWLVNGLVGLDHEVTFYGAKNSEIDCKVESVLPKPASELKLRDDIRRYYTSLLVSKCYQSSSSYDLIHSHLNLVPSFYAPLVNIPTVTSIHTPVSKEVYRLMTKCSGGNYISFSLSQRKAMPKLNWVANIYHGIDTTLFPFNAKPKPYLFYLGRVTEQKGVHLAIEAAKASGMQLIIAGYSYQDEGYWHEKIEKYIDGKTVRYVGEADFKQKIEYLRNATALLFPTQVNEHFGYCMIEAMACGTPVIGWKNGSVPEVVGDKKAGYVVDSVGGMVKAIKNIDKIDRQAVRDRVERLFSVEKMVSGYQKVYQRVIDDYQSKKKK